MKRSTLFRGDSAVLRGNFLLITISWIILFAAQPIPDTYVSLFLSLFGRRCFSIINHRFRGIHRSCPCPVSRRLFGRQTWQKMAYSLNDFRVSHWKLILYFCALMAIHSNWATYSKCLFYLRSSFNV